MFILIVWFAVLSIYVLVSFLRQKRRAEYLQSAMNNLEKKYLFTQITTRPEGLVEQLYFDLLRRSEKSMLEEITRISHARNEYQEYIEQWIHDIKGPLTSLKLKCENDMAGALHFIIHDVCQIENCVDKALFFARSENMDKDFLIRKTCLDDVVRSAIVKNKHLLMNTMHLDIAETKEIVHSDIKWLEFIIGQIIINATKYKTIDTSVLKIYAEKENNSTLLNIEDNGIGILPSELPRVFDKGFTGTNGRKAKQSTGLGLFLCKQLCEKMGHTIDITSTQGTGTIVKIGFRKHRLSYNSVRFL
jgi:signal transduction histidine kinase